MEDEEVYGKSKLQQHNYVKPLIPERLLGKLRNIKKRKEVVWLI